MSQIEGKIVTIVWNLNIFSLQRFTQYFDAFVETGVYTIILYPSLILPSPMILFSYHSVSFSSDLISVDALVRERSSNPQNFDILIFCH